MPGYFPHKARNNSIEIDIDIYENAVSATSFFKRSRIQRLRLRPFDKWAMTSDDTRRQRIA